MGTNYYWRYNHCDCCGRYDQRHICKSLISFEGYFEDGEFNEHTRQYDRDKPIIVSWQDWKRVLTSEPGRVFDEYSVEFTVDEFIKKVEQTAKADRRRQYDWIIDNSRNNAYPYPVGVAMSSNWMRGRCSPIHVGEFS